MAHPFGRTSNSGRNFIGTHKAVKMGLGRHVGAKTTKQAQPPTSAFGRKALSDASA